jgi:hypothetical protein
MRMSVIVFPYGWIVIVIAVPVNCLMTSTTCRISSGLIILELLDILLVNSALSLLLFPIRGLLLRTGIPPHFAQESRDICIAHVRVLLFDTLAATLREFEKRLQKNQ